MSIVDMFSDLVIGLATFIFWRMFTGAPAHGGGNTAAAAAPPLAPPPPPVTSDARSLPMRLDDICRATGIEGIEAFFAGAGRLYEALLPAFAAGDIAAWREFIADDVYQTFLAAIAERIRRGETTELVFIGIDSAEIADATLTDRLAEIAVRFVGLVVSVTRDADGKALAGHPTAVVKTTSVWTFTRELGATHPNWTLVATRPED